MSHLQLYTCVSLTHQDYIFLVIPAKWNSWGSSDDPCNTPLATAFQPEINPFIPVLFLHFPPQATKINSYLGDHKEEVWRWRLEPFMKQMFWFYVLIVILLSLKLHCLIKERKSVSRLMLSSHPGLNSPVQSDTANFLCTLMKMPSNTWNNIQLHLAITTS